MTIKKTATWALATVVLAATLLALADTGYAADRGRDRDHRATSAVRDGRRNADRSTTRDRGLYRMPTVTPQPWGRFDRNIQFYCPPVRPVQVIYVVPAQPICYQTILIQTSCLSFGLGLTSQPGGASRGRTSRIPAAWGRGWGTFRLPIADSLAHHQPPVTRPAESRPKDQNGLMPRLASVGRASQDATRHRQKPQTKAG
jgi:hypothetical protein